MVLVAAEARDRLALRRFPREAHGDVDRLHRVARGLFREKNGAIETARQ